MNSGIKRIFSITVAILVTASVLVTFYQISNFDEDEKIFQRVYEEQLDVLLYSINQYAEDIVNSWKRDLINSFESSEPTPDLINRVSEIDFAFVKDTNNNFRFAGLAPEEISPQKKELNIIFEKNSEKIDRLFEFYEKGYQKIEPLPSPQNDEILLLMIGLVNSEKTLLGISFNPEIFIQKNLIFRLEELSGNKFDIGVNLPVNLESSFYKPKHSKKGDLTKALWILPGFDIFLTLREDNIATLVSSKLKTNLIILISLSGLIIISAIFLFINFRKEMKLAQMKTDFISNVSHELRTPLALISMYSETLEMERVKDDKKRKEYYKIISSEAERLGKIVNNILNFSKMEAGKRKYMFGKTDISDLLGNIISTYSFHLKQSGFTINFTNEISAGKITCDREAIGEAVLNLIDNAVKYSKEKKDISVTLTENKNKIFISVKDSGMGIPADELNKIFDKFYRVSTGLRHNTKGSGIGLSIVKHIVDSHEGYINVKSSVDRGSEFIIELPKEKGLNNV
ncbi:MAG: sensor histidine kinase [Rhodothermaceae bacterium]